MGCGGKQFLVELLGLLFATLEVQPFVYYIPLPAQVSCLNAMRLPLLDLRQRPKWREVDNVPSLIQYTRTVHNETELFFKFIALLTT